MINKYVGSRYVPIYIGVHDETIEYEPLSIVSNTEKTETYTSKQYVPKGVSLDNETYWAQSGFSNADLQIDVDSAGYLSTDSSDLEIEKTKEGYLITLNASNSFDCGGEFGEAYTLNTLYDVGRYVINPSLCTGIPSELNDISNPAELVISEYTKKDEEIFYQYQKITAYDSDNAASFIRFHDGKNWSDWKMIGGNGGGSYTLPIASANTLGGVKIGSGVNVTDDGTISVSGAGGVGEWVNITDDCTFNSEYARKEFSSIWKNDVAKLCWIHLNAPNLMSNVEVGSHIVNADIVSGMPKAQENPNDEILFSGCAQGTSNILPWICTIVNDSNKAKISYFQYYSLYQGASNPKIEILYRIE